VKFGECICCSVYTCFAFCLFVTLFFGDRGSYHSSSLFFCFFLFFVLYPPICFGLGIKSYMFTFIKLWDVYHGTNVGACLYSIFWMSIVVK
jgi:hypothetical protein